MGLLDTTLIRFDPSLPYLTRSERGAFAELRKGGNITFFKTALCPCGAEVPKSKQYCSEECYKNGQPEQEEQRGKVDR